MLVSVAFNLMCICVILFYIFQESGKPELPKQFLSFADVSISCKQSQQNLLTYFAEILFSGQ